ncbi:MAG: hypothetical protein IJA27_01070 [Lachnospiraceae bacterium]|nr:hypothetical protein [Lachnospiraceae bacterium]
METGNLKKKELFVVRKRLIQKDSMEGSAGREWNTLSFWGQIGLLYVSMASLCCIMTSAGSISFQKPIVYEVLLLFCCVFSFYYDWEPKSIKWMRRLVSFIVLFFLLVLAVVTSSFVLTGGRSIINDIITQINRTYSGTLGLFGGAKGYTEYVLLLLLFIMTWFVAKGIIGRRDNLHYLFLGFPILLASVLIGGKIPWYALLGFLLCFQCMSILSGIRIRRKFWGGLGTKEYVDNKRVGRRISFRMAIFSITALSALAVLSFYVIRPGITKPMGRLAESVSPIKTEGIRFLQEFLPKISGGKLQFSVEGVGGGSSGGLLGEIEGTYYSREETLKIICTSLPTETVYLKGFVGTTYTGDKWLEQSEDNFENAAKQWKIQDEPSLYIQNLPFLRMIYALNELGGASASEATGSGMDGSGMDGSETNGSGTDGSEMDGSGTDGSGAGSSGEIEPNYMTIERYGEDMTYTYVPYQAYLNDYYRVLGGDGAIAGQNTYEDTYAWFSNDIYQETMEEWNKQEEKHGVLDEIASLYETYVTNQDTKLGDVDLSGLAELCAEKQQEWEEKLKAAVTEEQITDLTEEKYDDIKNFVRRTLLENCTFEAEAKKLPKGKDYISYFMFELKEGDSTAFASTAVMMFRMCGIPARYVEGYVAPVNLFSNNGDGTYTAVLQDDNAHAWVEIYVPGTGWTCVETTPGFDGTISNLEMPEEESTEAQDESDDKSQESNEENANKTLLERIFGVLENRIWQILISLLILLTVLVGRSILIRKRRRGALFKLTNIQKRKMIFYSFYEVLLFTGFSKKIDVTEPEFIAEVKKMYPEFEAKDLERYMSIVLYTHFGPQEELQPDAKQAVRLKSERDTEFSLEMYEKLVGYAKGRLKIGKKVVFRLWKAF